MKETWHVAGEMALPGRPKVGEMLGSAPGTSKPPPARVEEVMQVGLPLHTKATVVVESSRKRSPAGRMSTNWKLVEVPSGSEAYSR